MESVQNEALSFDFTPYEQSIEIAGSRLNYVDIGERDRPVILYVHGLMGTWRNWLFNILPYIDTHRVIAVDLPGFGKSEMPVATLTIENYAETLEKLLGALRIDRVTLIGSSMGGQVGTIFAKRTPELLERLMVVDPAGFSTSSKFLRRISPLAWILDLLLRLVARIPQVVANNAWLAAFGTKLILWKPRLMPPELLMVLLDGVGKRGFVPAVRTIVTTPVRPYPGQVTAETVIVWGRHDWLVPRRDAQRFAEMLPHASVEILEDTGHIPMYETPEQFNAMLDRYLDATPAEAVVDQAA